MKILWDKFTPHSYQRIPWILFKKILILTLCMIAVVSMTSITFAIDNLQRSSRSTVPIKPAVVLLEPMKLQSIDTAKVNELQKNLSRRMFWSDSVSRSIQVNISKALETNFAILDFVTFDAERVPNWSTYTDFSISSTAFTQLISTQIHPSHSIPQVQFSLDQENKLLRYETLFFPWLKLPINLLANSFNGRGIVISTGQRHFEYAFLLVKSLREVLKCDLPIEVMYANSEDLSSNNIQLISKFKNVTCIDLSTKLNLQQLSGVNSWWLKPFAILMSSFEEPLFLDADVLFVVNPETLFNHKLYLKYGVLMYRDRLVQTSVKEQDVKEMFPYPSKRLKESALWMGEGGHEGESGVLLFNKANPSSFFALLNACNLNRLPMRDIILKFFHGDKETFWMGFELLGLDYELDAPFGGAIGGVMSDGLLCGNLAHSDDEGNLVWINGGLVINKMEHLKTIIEFEKYTIDIRSETVKSWEWQEGRSNFCWKSEAHIMKEIPDAFKKLIGIFTSIYKDIRAGIFVIE